MSQFENFKIRRVIMHQIFGLNEDRERRDPYLNSVLAIVEGPALAELEKRVVIALGKRSNCVEMEIAKADTDSLFQICGSMIREKDENFITKSHRIARKLNDVQGTRSIPGGVVLIFEGTTSSNNEKFIGIIKAELHNGFSLVANDTSQAFNYVNDLFLTPSQKLYKIGIFIERFATQHKQIDEIKEILEYKAFVFDQNMSKSDTENAAIYFYNSFMGCQTKTDSKVLTKMFYNSTREFINNRINDEEEKMNLYYAVYSYFAVERSTLISVNDFSEKFLSDEIKDEYASFMSENKIPLEGIHKDIEMIKKQLKQRRIKFTSEVRITCPAEKFKEYVVFEKYDEDYSHYKIRGKILEQER